MGDWREKIESTPRSQEYLNEYRGDNLIAIAIAFALLPTLTLALRFYSKRFKGAHIGIDDAFIFAAYLVNLSLCAMGLCEPRPPPPGPAFFSPPPANRVLRRTETTSKQLDPDPPTPPSSSSH